MATVTSWTQGFLASISAGMAQFFGAIPYIIGALLILIIGWMIAGVVGALITKLAHAVKVDEIGDRIGANRFLERSGTKLRASNIFGEIAKWVIRLIFVEMAASQLGMAQVTQIINQILAFIPNIIVAIVVLGVGAFLGQILAGAVRGFSSEAGAANPELYAKLVNFAVVAFSVIAALNVLQVAPIVVNTLYIGLVSAIALALGLAFGLGGRDTAGRFTEQWVDQAQRANQKRATSASRTFMGTPRAPADPE
jgi:flagellar biosynthesis protein FliQ